MKKMTCKEMEGLCNMEMTANTPEEMMKKGQEHMEKYHPGMAEKMKSMTEDDKKKWNDGFMDKWENKPDVE